MGLRVDKNHLSCFSGLINEDKIYAVDTIYGLLMEYDIKNFSHRAVTQITCMDIRKGIYRIKQTIKAGNKFYFLLENSRDIIMWSQQNQSFQIYGSEHKYDEQRNVVSNAFLIKNNIWICPGYSNLPLRCFDIITAEIKEYPSVEYQMTKNGIKIEDIRFLFGAVDKETLWFAVYNTPHIASYDINHNKWKFYSFNEFGLVSNICFDGKDLWISFMQNNIFINWNAEEESAEVFKIPTGELDMSKGDPFNYIYGFKNYIYVLPTYDNNIYIVNRKTKEVYATDFFKNYKHTDIRPYIPLFGACLKYEKQLIVLPYSIDCVIVIDMETKQIQYIDSKISQQDKNFYIDYLPKGHITENNRILLKDYIYYVNTNSINIIREKEKGACGRAVIREIKRWKM